MHYARIIKNFTFLRFTRKERAISTIDIWPYRNEIYQHRVGNFAKNDKKHDNSSKYAKN